MGHFGLFCPNMTKWNFSQNPTPSVFDDCWPLVSCKKSEKPNERFLTKILNWCTRDRLTKGQSLNIFQRYWWSVISKHFGYTKTCLTRHNLDGKIWMFRECLISHINSKAITKLFLQILWSYSYFGALSVCRSMSEQTFLNWHDTLEISMKSNWMQKINITTHLLLSYWWFVLYQYCGQSPACQTTPN